MSLSIAWRIISGNDKGKTQKQDGIKSFGNSVRCLKDN